jgi:6-phosphogluconolactonase
MTVSHPGFPSRRAVAAGALGLLTAPAVQASAAKTVRLVYFGSQANEAGQGVFAARLDVNTGKLTSVGLAAELTRPTWIVAHPSRPALYAVSETGNDGKTQGKVHALKVDPKTGLLSLVSTVDSGGGGPTHMALDAHGLLVAHYGTGHVAALPVRVDGGVEPPASVQLDQGSGPSPRQKGPHAHSVALDPSGRFVLTADLGADRVFVYPYDRKARQLGAAAATSVSVPPGTGPRHMVFHPNGRLVFLISELIPEVRAYRWDAQHGRLDLAHTVRAAGDPPASGAESAEAVRLRQLSEVRGRWAGSGEPPPAIEPRTSRRPARRTCAAAGRCRRRRQGSKWRRHRTSPARSRRCWRSRSASTCRPATHRSG